MEEAFFEPPVGLRNRHVQTMLSSGPLRRALVQHWSRILRRNAGKVVLDTGNGVRLNGRYTPQNTAAQSQGLLVLLHGWEGSSESNYVLESGARALAEGWDVFRLNLRDHGDSHALNEGLFHSCLIDEAVGALANIAVRYQQRPMVLAGFSLGGNFALRMALRGPAAGIGLAAVLAVCPVVDPHHSLLAIESSPRMYERYFIHKWRTSLRIKQRAFPDNMLFTATELKLGLRDLTHAMVLRHTDFGDLDQYLDGYSIAADRLTGLKVPACILTSRDDPVIPIADFEPLKRIQAIHLDIAEHGGHCGFITGYDLRSYCPDYLASRLLLAKQSAKDCTSAA